MLDLKLRLLGVTLMKAGDDEGDDPVGIGVVLGVCVGVGVGTLRDSD